MLQDVCLLKFAGLCKPIAVLHEVVLMRLSHAQVERCHGERLLEQEPLAQERAMVRPPTEARGDRSGGH